MKTALRVHVALNEFVVGAICISILVSSFAYWKTHRPVAPAPVKADCTVKEPTVEISQIIYFLPTAPKVIVKVVVPKPEAFSSSKDNQPPDGFTPDPNLDHAPPPQPEQQPDPVFEHRIPIVTSALRTPMNELDKK